MTEKSIRNELRGAISGVHLSDWESVQVKLEDVVTDAILASPVIRRIQAEAIRQAAMEYGGWLNVGSPTTGEKLLYRIADRIEVG